MKKVFMIRSRLVTNTGSKRYFTQGAYVQCSIVMHLCRLTEVQQSQIQLCFSGFLNSQLTTIVATRWAYSVIDVMRTAVRTNSQSGHLGHVMGTTFGLAGVRLSSFRMCHILLVYCLLVYCFISRQKGFACKSRRLTYRQCNLFVRIVIFERCAEVVLEKGSHLWVATTLLVTMHYGKINSNQFVSQPREVKGMDGLFLPLPFIFLHMNGYVHRFETAVARYLYHTICNDLQVKILFTKVYACFHLYPAP